MQEEAGWGGRARSFKASSKVSDLSEVPWETADRFQAGKEGGNTCATLQSLDVGVSWASGPELPPRDAHCVSLASHLLLPSTFGMCRCLVFYLEVKDRGRTVLWKSPVLPLASVKYELMT